MRLDSLELRRQTNGQWRAVVRFNIAAYSKAFRSDDPNELIDHVTAYINYQMKRDVLSRKRNDERKAKRKECEQA